MCLAAAFSTIYRCISASRKTLLGISLLSFPQLSSKLSAIVSNEAEMCCTEAPREFQEQQTQRLIQSISAGEGPSWRADQQYTQFLQGPPLAQHAAEASGSHAWADEVTTHPAPNGNQWADSFQASTHVSVLP